MNIPKFLNWVAYNGMIKPTNSISDARWSAMLKWLETRRKEGFVPNR